ncbi:uncharacterized protein PFLUO_LOCUS2333 [Penicillium psychrofluorescens]|uniref:uncharacterized protein n=1 Tax=Penicillium psychrofluorescens TaxID=3158075 RepID=UPI003CCE3CFE
MAQLASPGLADLEKELVCSICTELLYQPQTLLDCLHTFCGSCVKEWFTAQGSRRRSSTSSSARFTCPSCRADVRGTRPNATVTTLVDMVLAAHPDRVKSAAEKDEIAERYKPSDSVFPLDAPHDESAEEDNYDDDRLLEEVRQLSMRESRAQARRENRRAHPSRTRERRNDSGRPADESRTRRRQDETSTEQRTQRPGGRSGRDGDRARRIEHQSSLRSLLSLSSEAETMEEEILRQIIEEGLLDDIDLDNLGSTQEEELSERIADAYRRRHMQRSNSRQSDPRRQAHDVTSQTQTRSQSAQRPSEPAPTSTSREQGDRRPPVSRPHLLDQSRPSNTHQRRNSDQTSERQHTSPLTLNQASASDDTLRPAAEPESYKILSFSTNCDICTYPIPASVTRFHCLECNGGDYDVCTNCYLKLVATSKISKENGHNGWRRCLAGHRMIIVGFEDHQSGQRRVIVRDLVGGRALKDEHVAPTPSSPAPTSPELGKGDWSWKDGPDRRKKASRLRGAMAPNNNITNSDSPSTGSPVNQQAPSFRRFPPDGGVGLIVHALWSWYPEDEVEDELIFPRGAEITEAENINDDWFWGCYAGRTGLFPGAHVTVVSEVV